MWFTTHLVSVNIQQVLMNINGCNFFPQSSRKDETMRGLYNSCSTFTPADPKWRLYGNLLLARHWRNMTGRREACGHQASGIILLQLLV